MLAGCAAPRLPKDLPICLTRRCHKDMKPLHAYLLSAKHSPEENLEAIEKTKTSAREHHGLDRAIQQTNATEHRKVCGVSGLRATLLSFLADKRNFVRQRRHYESSCLVLKFLLFGNVVLFPESSSDSSTVKAMFFDSLYRPVYRPVASSRNYKNDSAL